MKILAAIDQSEYAVLVIRKAVELAGREGADITAMTVTSAQFNNLYQADSLADILQKLRDGIQETLSQAGVTNDGVKVVAAENPSPADAIVRYAEDNGVDLIVIGNKGSGAIERFLIGSVSSQVVAHAPCSVLVVKKQQ
ncbi:MAG TPA: universal stress protein [Deltaproteobacteria bacterium]|nr:universal stress protein [Deltaproteobacteria bacterium]HQB38856.1 universal stress protein [Deltaproteobacteria bacterium]